MAKTRQLLRLDDLDVGQVVILEERIEGYDVQGQVNLTLASAAPELVEALWKTLAIGFWGHMPPAKEAAVEDVIESIHSALAKAGMPYPGSGKIPHGKGIRHGE